MIRRKAGSPLKDPVVRRMGLLCLVGFGGFLVWATVAPLEEGVAAVGKIILEDNRQQVQHFEGGIVDEIFVREGDLVEAGQTLVVLRSTASRSNRNQVIQSYAALSASLERLDALQNADAQPVFASLDVLDIEASDRDGIIKRETGLFQQEQKSLTADIGVLRARISTARQVQSSKTNEIEIAERGLVSARSELDVISAMVDEQLARRDRLTETERLVSSIEGDISRLTGERADARANEADLRAQIEQANARASQRWAIERLSISADLQAAEEQLDAAQDVLARAVITAPVSGEVLNLTASTLGGVVRSGDTLMEIIPALSEIVAAVQVMPADRPVVYEGLLVRTQLSSYKGWQAPRLDGRVIGVSADLKTDPVTRVSYYEARVLIPPSELARVENANVLPGMPVDTFIYSGKSRTLLQYIMEPLSDSLFRGLRES
jgi:HlyD family type I secretion membrane fusion protein